MKIAFSLAALAAMLANPTMAQNCNSLIGKRVTMSGKVLFDDTFDFLHEFVDSRTRCTILVLLTGHGGRCRPGTTITVTGRLETSVLGEGAYDLEPPEQVSCR